MAHHSHSLSLSSMNVDGTPPIEDDIESTEECSIEEFEAMIERHVLFPVLVQLRIQMLMTVAPADAIETAPLPEPSIFLGQDLVLDQFMLQTIQQTEQYISNVHAKLSVLASRLNGPMPGKTSKRTREPPDDEDEQDTSEPDPKRQRTRDRLPRPAVEILMSWLRDHLDSPFPTADDKARLAASSKLSVSQVSQWFTNARRRVVKELRHSSEATNHSIDRASRASPSSRSVSISST